MIILISVTLMLVFLAAAPCAERALTIVTQSRRFMGPIAERARHLATSRQMRRITACGLTCGPTSNARTSVANDLRFNVPPGQCANAGLRDVLLLLEKLLREVHRNLRRCRAVVPPLKKHYAKKGNANQWEASAFCQVQSAPTRRRACGSSKTKRKHPLSPLDNVSHFEKFDVGATKCFNMLLKLFGAADKTCAKIAQVEQMIAT
jgi:hypothetical protein